MGIPVAEMADAYSKETLALSNEIETYASMDLYDSERPKIVQVRPYAKLLCKFVEAA